MANFKNLLSDNILYSVVSSIFEESSNGDQFVDSVFNRGEFMSQDVSGILGGTDGINATGLPLGLSVNAGVISGTPLSYGPANTVTLTRGAAVITAQWSVTVPLAAAPRRKIANLDVIAADAAGLFEPIVTAADASALFSAITTARGDTGTITTPKFHHINYTGPDVASYTPFNSVTDVDDHDINTYIWITGNGAGMGRLRPDNGDNCLTIFDDWVIDRTEGGTHIECTRHHAQYFRCKIGQYWRDGDIGITRGTGFDIIRGTVSIEACHLAQITNIIQVRGGHLGFVGNFVTHIGNDLGGVGANNSFDVSPYVWDVGTVLDRPVDNPTGLNHPDLWQLQNTGNGSNVVDVTIDVYGSTSIFGTVNYGSTGIRDASTIMASDYVISDSVFAITGYDALVPYTTDFVVDGFVVGPAPEIGALSGRATFYDTKTAQTPPGNASISNYVLSSIAQQNGWTGFSPATSGSEITYLATGADHSTVFPKLTGSIKTAHYLTGAPSRFVPDFVQSALHPISTRQTKGDLYEPSVGWSALGMSDRATMVGPMDSVWGSVPSIVLPTASLTGSIDPIGAAASMTITTDATSGVIHWVTTTTSGAIPYAGILAGADPDNKAQSGGRIEHGHYRFSSGGPVIVPLDDTLYTDGTTYHLSAFVEDASGGVSPIDTASVIADEVMSNIVGAPVSSAIFGSPEDLGDGVYRFSTGSGSGNARLVYTLDAATHGDNLRISEMTVDIVEAPESRTLGIRNSTGTTNGSGSIGGGSTTIKTEPPAYRLVDITDYDFTVVTSGGTSYLQVYIAGAVPGMVIDVKAVVIPQP